jgi:hypothetical protein
MRADALQHLITEPSFALDLSVAEIDTFHVFELYKRKRSS